MFEHLHRWLILETNISNTVQLLNDSTFSIITDFTIALSMEDDDYILYDVYNHCKHCGGSLNITELGTWTRSNGLNVTLSQNTFARRWNFHQLKVKIAGLVSNGQVTSLTLWIVTFKNDEGDRAMKIQIFFIFRISIWKILRSPWVVHKSEQKVERAVQVIYLFHEIQIYTNNFLLFIRNLETNKITFIESWFSTSVDISNEEYRSQTNNLSRTFRESNKECTK